MDRGHRRRLQLRCAAGSPPHQRQTHGDGGPQPRRATVGTRRPPHPAQSLGHAHPAARGLSPQDPRPRRSAHGGRGEHSRSRRVQAARPRPAAAIRRPSAEESARSVLRQRRNAGSGGGRPIAAARRFPRQPVRSPHPPQSRSHPGAIDARRPCRQRAVANHQGSDARRQRLHAASRLSVGKPAPRPAAALRRGVQLRRLARQRLRAEFPRYRRQIARANSARSSTWPTSSAWGCATNGWESTSD